MSAPYPGDDTEMDLGYVNRSRNTDQLDFAADLQDEFNKRGLDQVRKAMAAETHPDFDGAHCVTCGDDMPPERLAMERIRCTPCQQAKEKKR